MNRPSLAGPMGGGSSLFAPTAALVMLAGRWLHWRYGHAWPAPSGHAWGSDDAYITYRYTLNLWNGWGPVYNPGHAAVEGYSNPLYMFALVPLLALVGPDRLYDATVALNAVALLATVPLLARLGTHLLPGWPIGQGLVLLLAAVFPPLWQAAASGLETAIVYALQLALMTLILTPPIRHVEVVLAFVAACLVAIRIDGFTLAGAVTVLLVLAGRWRSALSILSGTTAMLVSLTLWRLSYYGLPLPNSVYAKVHGGWKARLAAAVKQAAFVLPSTGIVPWVLLPLFAVPRVLRSFAARGGVDLRAPEVLLAGVPLALTSYWFLVGGDVFFERFLLLAYPLGLLVAFRALRIWRPAIAALVFTVLILNCVPLMSRA